MTVTNIEFAKLFCNNLGFHPANDRFLLRILKSANTISVGEMLPNNRERTPSTKKINTNIIKEHILKFNPTISHYRREHAPNVLYLPSDISPTLVYQNFLEEHKDLKFSIDIYRRCLKEMNIHFTKLSHVKSVKLLNFITQNTTKKI